MLITLPATSSICFGTKKFASWLFVMMHSVIYFTWAIWLVWQHADMLVWLRPSFTMWTCPDPIFRQGCRVHVKDLASDDKTKLLSRSEPGYKVTLGNEHVDNAGGEWFNRFYEKQCYVWCFDSPFHISTTLLICEGDPHWLFVKWSSFALLSDACILHILLCPLKIFV